MNDEVAMTRSRIAQFLRSSAGDPGARKLLAEAADALAKMSANRLEPQHIAAHTSENHYR